MVKTKREKRLVAPKITGLKADRPGGPVVTPFTIPAHYAISSREEWTLQMYDKNTLDWVDVPVVVE